MNITKFSIPEFSYDESLRDSYIDNVFCVPLFLQKTTSENLTDQEIFNRFIHSLFNKHFIIKEYFEHSEEYCNFVESVLDYGDCAHFLEFSGRTKTKKPFFKFLPVVKFEKIYLERKVKDGIENTTIITLFPVDISIYTTCDDIEDIKGYFVIAYNSHTGCRCFLYNEKTIGKLKLDKKTEYELIEEETEYIFTKKMGRITKAAKK